jgi:hypothetical protein
MQNHDEQKRGDSRSEKAKSRRGSGSRPDVGRFYRQRWITQQIKAKLLEEGHPEECRICGAKGDLRVNHDTTGFVRGLLCGSCNKASPLQRSRRCFLRLVGTVWRLYTSSPYTQV